MRSLKIKSSNYGFTLIELIVVFTVLAVLSVVGVASFVSYSRSQALSSDGASIKSLLNLARSNAISQAKPSDASYCAGTLQGYIVELAPPGFAKNYDMKVKCSISGVSTQVLPFQSYKLSPNITFDSRDGTNEVSSIFYSVLSGGVKITNINNSLISTGKIVLNSGYSVNTHLTIDIDSAGGAQ